jgi:hypothetical protein
MTEHTPERQRTSAFAHGRVDPRVAGAKGGSAPRQPVSRSKVLRGIFGSGNGAAIYAAARDMGLLDRQRQSVPEPP